MLHFNERLHLLYQWSSHLLDTMEFAQQNGAPEVASHYAEALRNVIDAYVIIGVAVEGHVPANVMTWYEAHRA